MGTRRGCRGETAKNTQDGGDGKDSALRVPQFAFTFVMATLLKVTSLVRMRFTVCLVLIRVLSPSV